MGYKGTREWERTARMLLYRESIPLLPEGGGDAGVKDYAAKFK